MRIEIMIDKEQKISQSTLDALESELLPQSAPPVSQNGNSYPQR
ncbi:prophage protein [Salmonella enterica subsp. enterica]|nr:prophage protein [Salmonella enterica subsp. enterica]